MSNWAERVHRRAANFGSVVTFCGYPGSYRMEKVKFGVPLEEVCKNNNIPGPLLVLILKLNKESPNRRDVFRAPGHQGAMKKLIHFLQSGRLVNVDKYSVYTIASVLKKFLRKIPNGIFGRDGEKELFNIIELQREAEQVERWHRLFTALPKYAQHLLVLLFGTFRVIASNSEHANTGMTSEALGVSVAPSFFQSCVSDGKTARMEDVLRFKVATRIIKDIIDKFATHDLFGRDNYEYYARVTGRILKVQDEWICSFQYPPPPRGKIAQQRYALQHSLEAEKTWLQCQCERWLLIAQEESHSTPVLLSSSSSALDNSLLSLSITPEHSFLESSARLSVSLEGSGLYALSASGGGIMEAAGTATSQVAATSTMGIAAPPTNRSRSVEQSHESEANAKATRKSVEGMLSTEGYKRNQRNYDNNYDNSGYDEITFLTNANCKSPPTATSAMTAIVQVLKTSPYDLQPKVKLLEEVANNSERNSRRRYHPNSKKKMSSHKRLPALRASAVTSTPKTAAMNADAKVPYQNFNSTTSTKDRISEDGCCKSINATATHTLKINRGDNLLKRKSLSKTSNSTPSNAFSCPQCRCACIRHSFSCLTATAQATSGGGMYSRGDGGSVSGSAIAQKEVLDVLYSAHQHDSRILDGSNPGRDGDNDTAAGAIVDGANSRILTFLPQIRDDLLLASRVSV